MQHDVPWSLSPKNGDVSASGQFVIQSFLLAFSFSDHVMIVLRESGPSKVGLDIAREET